MTHPPTFASTGDFRARLGDVEFWRPYVDEVLRRSDLPDTTIIEPGSNPTWPTFLCYGAVVKLFGHHAVWRTTFDAERNALAAVASDPEILAPRVLGKGDLYNGPDRWPFLVIARRPGRAAWPARPPAERWPSLARQLGTQVRRLHALRPVGVATDADWPGVDPVAAAEQSSLPAHLVAQVEEYLARLPHSDAVFVHGDLVAQHVFVEDGRLTGIIDWADAMVTDRHYELAQIFRDTFDCDKELLRIFLDASDWPVGPDFAQLAMGQALRRQGFMLAQHPGGDVFMPIAEKFPLDEIATFDELAEVLFAV